MNVGGRMKWHRSQDENDKCMCARACVCVCVPLEVWHPTAPPMADGQPPIWLAARQKKMAYYWPSVDRFVNVCVCVCARKHLFERQLCLQMRFRCTHRHPPSRARVPPRGRGIKEGRMHFDGLPPSLPPTETSHWCVRMLRWVHEKKIKIKQEIMREWEKEKCEGWKKNKATLF